MDGHVCRAGSAIPAIAQPRHERKSADVSAVLVRVLDRFFAWRERARSRRVLLSLDERMLRDIGIDRATAAQEGGRPFWDA